MGDGKKYNVSISENEGIVELVITGEVPDDLVGDMEREVQDMLQAIKPKKVLADVRSLKIHLSVTHTYIRVRNVPPPLRVKTAVLDIPEHAEFQQYHENTANNAGIPMKAFTDIEKARAWLKSDRND